MELDKERAGRGREVQERERESEERRKEREETPLEREHRTQKKIREGTGSNRRVRLVGEWLELELKNEALNSKIAVPREQVKYWSRRSRMRSSEL